MSVVEYKLSAIETEVIDIFVRGTQLLGLPRSFGEIYGLLFISPEPLSMDQITGQLNISIGSASRGLKELRAFKAVKATYRPGERKDYYVAEAEFRKLTAGFFKEEVFPHLESVLERLQSLQTLLNDVPSENAGHFQSRIEKLERWHSLSFDLIPKVINFINF